MNNKPTIHQVYVKVESQSQADKLRAVCIDYGLPIWEDIDAFEFFDEYQNFVFDGEHFWIKKINHDKQSVTEPQFIALCEEWVKENNK
jgi:hypothetical protein